MFQFQNGAIKRITDFKFCICGCGFQFQNGAIKRISKPFVSQRNNLFQFQNGAIKSLLFHQQKKLYQQSFNSKMVRLKVSDLNRLRNVPMSFNSKMVRLKVFTQHRTLIGYFRFQFQNGAIKSPLES